MMWGMELWGVLLVLLLLVVAVAALIKLFFT